MINLREIANNIRRQSGKSIEPPIKVGLIGIDFDILIKDIVKKVIERAKLGEYQTSVFVLQMDGYFSYKQELDFYNRIEHELGKYFSDTFNLNIDYYGIEGDEMYVVLEW